VTSVNGGGSCGQNTAATGYLTQYFYDALNDLISVVQNAQSANKQTRSYFYDGLGRLTSETNPESGTKNYYYDSDSTMCGNGVQTFHGDLVKTTDNAGNCIAMFYDALHRLTDVGNSNQSVSHCKRFRYDNSSGYPGSTKPSGLANTLGRLVEAATDQCVTGNDAIITDEWFSYTALGQPSTVYESTPHSGGYYGTGASYWPNGVPSSITGMVYSVNYNVDGEGRIYSTSNVAGQNLLTSTYYNYASQPTQVNFGSGDSDTFTYDSKSNRMTQYKFSVNGQSVTGTLTWNAIGTLGTLAVTDQFYGPGNQTCSYTHDDMSRIAGANCGSPWNQTFSYDAFGNISKSGTISFQPTYSYLTNHMTQIGSSTPNYDGNGNVLNDTAHTYTWDVYGKPITIDGVTLTYDALGRMVEQNRNGSYTEIDYAPTGAKLQILQGQQAITDFNRLPGGAVAVDLASAGGLAYYRHSDWLGSSRLASTPSRTIYYDGAYAPFGENYAQTGTTDLSFTGMNQDTVSNLFDFPAREYNAIHGRWPSPDPGGLSSVHSGDPQTLNRYAYVRNSPLGFTDSTGMDLDECDDTCGDPDGGGGGGGGGACDPTVDPTCGGDPGSCDPDVCGDDGNGQDDNNCDANCQQQIDQAELQAVNALNNSECALAVDGGTGRAAGTIKGSSSSLGTITTGDLGSGGVAASTQNLGGNQSQITLNTNPTLGFLNGPIPGYTPLASQAISLLHDLGHAAENAGVSTAVVDDSLGATGDLLASIDLSVQNSYTVGDACFPQGDGGQNQGPIDDGSTPVAAAKRTRRRF
jgi:RHS repeat-associated protein